MFLQLSLLFCFSHTAASRYATRLQLAGLSWKTLMLMVMATLIFRQNAD
jgi:hypothetical protein